MTSKSWIHRISSRVSVDWCRNCRQPHSNSGKIWSSISIAFCCFALETYGFDCMEIYIAMLNQLIGIMFSFSSSNFSIFILRCNYFWFFLWIVGALLAHWYPLIPGILCCVLQSLKRIAGWIFRVDFLAVMRLDSIYRFWYWVFSAGAIGVSFWNLNG